MHFLFMDERGAPPSCHSRKSGNLEEINPTPDQQLVMRPRIISPCTSLDFSLIRSANPTVLTERQFSILTHPPQVKL